MLNTLASVMSHLAGLQLSMSTKPFMAPDPAMKKVVLVIIVCLLVTTLPLSTVEASSTTQSVEDPQDDFTTKAGQPAKEPFLDIRNVTVSFDESSDKIIVSTRFFSTLPAGGPNESTGNSSSYYYLCSFETGQNVTIDQAVVVLEANNNWDSASLITTVRGNTYDGAASPVKYTVRNDTIIFSIPPFISGWGGRTKQLIIKFEAGYEHYPTPNPVQPDILYYDNAPNQNAITFNIPTAPVNPVPIVIVVGIIAASALGTWRMLHKNVHTFKKNS